MRPMAPKEIASKGAGSDFARIVFKMFLPEQVSSKVVREFKPF
jgi:hypothetical protein